MTTSHSTSYNFAADSLHWSDISSSFGFQVLPNYLFTIRTRHSFYHKFEDDPNKVRIPELTYWAYDLSKSFNWSGDFNSGLASQMGKYRKDSWSASLDYRYSFSSTRVGRKVFRDNVSHSTGISASLHPTENWSMTYTTRYSYTEGRFASHEFTFDRTLHCWKIDFTWTPTGPAAGWSFAVYVKDLPDIRLNAASTDDGEPTTTCGSQLRLAGANYDLREPTTTCGSLYLIRIVRKKEKERKTRLPPAKTAQTVRKCQKGSFAQNRSSLTEFVINSRAAPRQGRSEVLAKNPCHFLTKAAGPHHFPCGFFIFCINCPNFTNSAACAKNQKKPHHFPCGFFIFCINCPNFTNSAACAKNQKKPHHFPCGN